MIEYDAEKIKTSYEIQEEKEEAQRLKDLEIQREEEEKEGKRLEEMHLQPNLQNMKLPYDPLKEFDRELVLYCKAIMTMYHMLDTRGYEVPRAKLEKSLLEFATEMSKDNTNLAMKSYQLWISAFKNSDPDDKIIVFFERAKKVSANTISEYIERVKQAKAQRCIIVIKGEMTPSAIKASEALGTFIRVEIFPEFHLYYRLLSHKLVPKHEIVTKEEKEEILKKYKIKASQLPRMSVRDPVAKYFGLQKKDVVRIVRHSETAGKYITYRIVY